MTAPATPEPAPAPEPRDRGVSLVEVLVAMGLFGLLGTLLLGFALGTSQVTDDTRSLAAVNEESRLAMERLARELRQAERIDAFTFPADPAADPIAITFWTDFDGDGARDLGVVDPEVLTYRWRPTTKELTLTVDDASGTAVTRPMLAVNVSAFGLGLHSSRWEYDLDADGLTTWRELDQAVGDNDGVPDPAELALVDRVDVSMTVLDGARSQTHRTQIDLRNGS
jgi:prepilin-type N-terminal cleavage/methylation domain-containing protein